MDLPENVRNTLAKMAEKLGIKKSDAQQTATLRKSLLVAKAENLDQLDELKKEIRALEDHARKLKKDYEAAHGATKRVLEGEIRRTLTELDKLQDRDNIISRNLEHISTLDAKLREVEAASKKGASQDQIDDLSLQASEVFDELADEDKAVEDLEKRRYTGREKEQSDIEARLAELEEPRTSGLPKDLEKRLKDLEPEKE